MADADSRRVRAGLWRPGSVIDSHVSRVSAVPAPGASRGVKGPLPPFSLTPLPGRSAAAGRGNGRTRWPARIRWALLADVSAETSHAIAPSVSAETSAGHARALPAGQAIRGPGALTPGRGCGGVRSSMVRSGNMTAPGRYGRMLVLFVRG